jgi:hypothetical protein
LIVWVHGKLGLKIYESRTPSLYLNIGVLTDPKIPEIKPAASLPNTEPDIKPHNTEERPAKKSRKSAKPEGDDSGSLDLEGMLAQARASMNKDSVLPD